MTPWIQSYDPLNNLWLSAFVAALPIFFFFAALTIFRLKGYVASTLTVSIALAVAIFFYNMPVVMAFTAVGYGFAYGLWPIAWIIISAVFLYKITVKTGQFDIIRSSILSVTEDQRLQMLLVGFAFGSFLEGAAGFGAPVAITSALLVGLGFNPLYAAGLCLIANTAPVAFGAMGVPIITAGKITNIDPIEIGKIVGLQLPFLAVLVPFWLVAIMDGKKGLRETWPAILVVGVSFAVTQFLTSHLLGPELPDITSALVSLVCLTTFLKFWQPKNIFRFENSIKKAKTELTAEPSYTKGQIIKAWMPFGFLTLMVTIWTLKPFKDLFVKGGALAGTVIQYEVAGLHKMIATAAPITNQIEPIYNAVLKFDLLSATGTAIFISALMSMALLKLKPSDGVAVFAETLSELKKPILSIGMVLGFAFIAKYSGLSSTLALLLAGTGKAYPFFAPLVGWLGVFLTGSDTSSNALFSSLQQTTAHQIGVNDTLLVASNTTGGVTGKMISPQSIAIACAAVGLVGRESDLFRFTVKHSLIFATIIGLMTYFMAYGL